MRYAGIIKNDFSAAPGVCVSFFTQGCPHHCEGCHNPETWDPEGGYEFTTDTLKDIIKALQANNIHRDLCIMGGEPLCPDNQFLTLMIVNEIKEKLPDTKIYIWTGYTLNELKQSSNIIRIKQILSKCEMIIDGRFIESKRDISLYMRGSANQNIIKCKDINWDIDID